MRENVLQPALSPALPPGLVDVKVGAVDALRPGEAGVAQEPAPSASTKAGP